MLRRLQHSLSKRTSLSTAIIDIVMGFSRAPSMSDVLAAVHDEGVAHWDRCSDAGDSSSSPTPSRSPSPQPSSRLPGDGRSTDSVRQGDSDACSAGKAEGSVRCTLLCELGRCNADCITILTLLAAYMRHGSVDTTSVLLHDRDSSERTRVGRRLLPMSVPRLQHVVADHLRLAKMPLCHSLISAAFGHP